ncbi:MAG: hypothetical protein ACTHM0_05920 [Sphingomonas sp.]
MKTFVKKAGLGLALGATAIGLGAAPAQAQRWHGGYHGYHHYHHGGRTSAALLGGLVGLGVGAAIASNNRDRYYYDDDYYAPPPPPTVYEYRYDYRPRCWSQWRWDPYYGENVRVQVCR